MILNQIAPQGVSCFIVTPPLATCSCLGYSIKTLPCGGVYYDEQSYDTSHLKYFTEFAFSEEDASLWAFQEQLETAAGVTVKGKRSLSRC